MEGQLWRLLYDPHLVLGGFSGYISGLFLVYFVGSGIVFYLLIILNVQIYINKSNKSTLMPGGYTRDKGNNNIFSKII